MKRFFSFSVVFLYCFISLFAVETPFLGPNVHVYGPMDDQSRIAAELDSIHNVMRYGQFSNERHAIYFLPGDYTRVGLINVPYYMSVSGLGATPYEVKLCNISTPSPIRGTDNALCTFWRSIENFYVVRSDRKPMRWGVSQAAPMRRIVSERIVLFDMGGFASGGFSADCVFLDLAGTKSQQQWYMRNSYLEKGIEGMTRSGWNYGFQGVKLGKGLNYSKYEDSWTKGGYGCNLTFFDSTPIVREKPFLFVDKKGIFKVFVPSFRRDCRGVSYSEYLQGEGAILDLVSDFYIAMPGVTAAEINDSIRVGKNVFFTPGVYELETPIVVDRDGAVLIGTGLATLVPGKENSEAAVIVSDKAEGVVLSALMFDALYNSHTLLKVGTSSENARIGGEPVFLSDIFCRVGGIVDRNVNADIMVEINRNGVVGDHFWLWRADHGAGVGWFRNTCRNGLVVNGDDVTIYALLNEHAQEYQTIWNGERGTCYFYQSETPYDMQSQDDYMSHDGMVNGYASYKVGDGVKNHFATMIGIYDVFVKTGGAKIESHCSVEVPDRMGVHLHHVCNFGLSQYGGGFRYIVNDSVPSTLGRRITRWYLLDYGE